jgi:hypothetical protein
MTKREKPTTVLELSKDLGYGFLYQPIIGKVQSEQNPTIPRFRRIRPGKNKKFLG